MKSENHRLLIDLLKNELEMADPKLTKWNKKYFYSRKRRYESDLQLVQEVYSTGEILEIGSFPYHLTYCLKKMGYPIVGLDLHPERAQEFIEKHGLNIVKCDIEKERIPFDDNRFNLILFNEIFEHLRIDPIASMKEVNRVLSPSGILILTTPNIYYLLTILRFLVGGSINDACKEFEKLHTLGHMGHLRVYTRKEVQCFLQNGGFVISSVEYKSYHKVGIIGGIYNVCIKFVPKRLRPNLVFISKKA